MGGATIVSFRHNEKPLGAAFTIEGWTGTKLRPVVSLGKEGQVGRPASFEEMDEEDDEDDASIVDPTIVPGCRCQSGRCS